MPSLRILIVGGGIAGLALGRALREQGVVLEIIERAASWPTRGTGLYLPGNGVRALEALGLADTDARFVTAAELIDDLFAAFRSGRSPTRSGRTSSPASSSWTKWATSRPGPTPPTCSSTSSTIGTARSARWSSQPTRRCRRGGACCTTMTSRRPSSIGILERGRRLLTLDGPSMRTKHIGLDDPTSPGA
jgi:2-polyprenyl-6-methoxyphenol hydroxylase-like FAD-dependent oxidoreductase